MGVVTSRLAWWVGYRPDDQEILVRFPGSGTPLKSTQPPTLKTIQDSRATYTTRPRPRFETTIIMFTRTADATANYIRFLTGTRAQIKKSYETVSLTMNCHCKLRSSSAIVSFL
jgi:hypothetical protein